MSPRLPLLALALSTGCLDGVTFETGEQVPEFELEDTNTSSTTYGELMGPATFHGVPSAWYFGHST